MSALQTRQEFKHRLKHGATGRVFSMFKHMSSCTMFKPMFEPLPGLRSVLFSHGDMSMYLKSSEQQLVADDNPVGAKFTLQASSI